jgi:hypothetical protein
MIKSGTDSDLFLTLSEKEYHRLFTSLWLTLPSFLDNLDQLLFQLLYDMKAIELELSLK